MPRRPGRRKPGSETELRIVGGQMRGRTIRYHGDPRTRPMKDRVREAVFNLIGPRVVGAHAIDLFAGTGALALEAVSRGARSATVIERHGPTLRLAEENIRALGAAAQFHSLLGDAFFWAERIAEGSVEHIPAEPWLVFCSPPYQLYVDRPAETTAALAALYAAAPAGTVFVIESDERFDGSGLPPGPWQERAYPPAHIRVGQK